MLENILRSLGDASGAAAAGAAVVVVLLVVVLVVVVVEVVVVVLVVVLVEVLVEVVVEGGVFTYLAIKAVMVGYEANTSLVIVLLVHPIGAIPLKG